MNRAHVAVWLAAVAIAMALFALDDASARQGGRRERERQAQPEIKTLNLSPEEARKSFLGTWNDELGRFWFTIDDIAENQVRSAKFHLAHLKSGHIEGGQLTLLSASCVPLVGCYGYAIDGKLIAPSRMDMHATDDAGETVHFVLVKK